MSQAHDFFRTERQIPATDYWRYGRILALLGIWFQIGLLVNIFWVTSQWDNPGRPFALTVLGLALLKNLALFLYCRSREFVDDRLGPWTGALGLDVLLFVVLVPLLDREALDVTGVYAWLGLHYALAACLRWRSRVCYASLGVPLLFLVTAAVLGDFPQPEGAITLFLLGVVFIVGTREAFILDARRVEDAARSRRRQQFAFLLVIGEYVSLVTGELTQHRQVLTPLRRIEEGLRSANEREAADIASEALLRVRRLLGERVEDPPPMSVDALMEYARQMLVEHGMEIEAPWLEGRLQVPSEGVRAFVQFLRAAGVPGQLVEVQSVVGRAIEISSSTLKDDVVDRWRELGWVERTADWKSVLFYLDRR